MSVGKIKIVLVEPSHPGNVGAAARAAKTMGIENLVLVNPESFPNPKATARATSAADVLERAEVYPTLKQAIASCTFVVGTTARIRGLPCPEITPRKLGERVRQEIAHGDVALVFGRESSGLSNEEMDLCQFYTTIPTNWEFSALNLAAAVQVISYEVLMATVEATARGPVQVKKHEAVIADEAPANKEELEGYFQHLNEVLLEIEFLDPKQPKLLMRRLRHIYHRCGLNKLEVNILRGILSCTQRMVNLSKTNQDS